MVAIAALVVVVVVVQVTTSSGSRGGTHSLTTQNGPPHLHFWSTFGGWGVGCGGCGGWGYGGCNCGGLAAITLLIIGLVRVLEAAATAPQAPGVVEVFAALVCLAFVK